MTYSILWVSYYFLRGDIPADFTLRALHSAHTRPVFRSRMEDVGVIPDREEAIKFTIENAVEDDVIVIAGKGHENYQIIGDKTLHFSDQEVAEAYLTKK